MKKTLFDRLWDSHVVKKIDDNTDLLALDRIFLHDLCGMFSFQMMDFYKTSLYDKSKIFATPDHTIPSGCLYTKDGELINAKVLPVLREGCKKHGVSLFDVGSGYQGIVHIVGPETGLTLPGMTLACGDSHTCTHGAVGALAMGVGTSELYHSMVTSCLRVKRPKTLKINITGKRNDDVGPMDIILYIISKLGISFGVGYAIEYSGPVVHAMPMEERFSLCNLNVELGSEYAIIAPDDITLDYIENKEYAPKGEMLALYKEYCRDLGRSVEDGEYDKVVEIDASLIKRQISWGINPGHTISIDDVVPQITEETPEDVAIGYEKAYSYTGLTPGQEIRNLPIQHVFIGSCSNGRLSNIKLAVDVVKGRHVAEGVDAWIVPGSEKVKAAAEKLGYDKILIEAGFKWGNPGCSLCVGSNGETIPPGEHCVSTTNRNFIGRQGTGAITHLASPITAALSAIAGRIS